jgi:beta-aspartyl-dipeptidase (metallo-type)
MLTLIENGFVYAPEPRGVQSVLFAGDRIEKIGGVDRRALEAAGLDLEVIDARTSAWREWGRGLQFADA